MELDELKNIYAALDKKFDRNSNFNEKIYTEMMKNKGEKSTSRLLTYELIGAAACILAAPVLVFHFSIFHGWFFAYDLFMTTMMILLPFIVIWQIFKSIILMKINFQNSISSNIYHINRYNIFIKREKITTLIIVPLIFISIIIVYTHVEVAPWKWALLTCGFAFATLINYWTFKKFYKDNIASIVESLNELKELDEEREE